MQNGLIMEYYYRTAYRTNTPVSAVIELNTQCNVDCVHCYLPEHKNKGLKYEDVIRIVDEAKEIGVSHLLLTGGEIFTRKDILDIVREIRRRHIRVTLLSNGTLLNEDIVQKLSDMYIFQFSTTLFSMDKEIHDKITRVPGSWDRLMKSIELLQKYNIRVKIKMPIINLNADSVDGVREFCKKRNIEFNTSPIIFPQNDGNKEPLTYRLKCNQLVETIKKLDEVDGFTISPVHQRDVPCAAIFYSFAIDCNGDFYPCNSFMYKVGSIFENSLKHIWYYSEKLNQVKKIKTCHLKECGHCEKKDFCERCPGLAFAESNDFISCDSYAKEVATIRQNGYRM